MSKQAAAVSGGRIIAEQNYRQPGLGILDHQIE